MSTQLAEHETHWVVSTVSSPGKRSRHARAPVLVFKGDMAALKDAILQAAELARSDAGVDQQPRRPVV